MTRKEARELLPLIQAYAEGKTIQRIDDKNEWNDLCIVNFDFSPNKYRIKPELKYRPFKTQEECWDEMLKHQPFGWVRGKYSKVLYHIESIASDRVVYAFGNHMSFDFIVKNYEFVDGTPLGIKEG